MTLNAAHLRTLRAVLETGSFADAGRLLGYTASAVSQQIGALERSADIVLFERGARGVQPTTVAHVLGERARSTLAALDDLERDVRKLATGQSGRLHLGAFTTASTCIVPPAVANFTATRPNAEIRLAEGNPDQLMDRLLTGELDVLLVFEYGLVPRDWPHELAALEVFREDLVLLMPIADPVVQRPHLHLSDLRDARWIGGYPGSAGAIALERLCAAHGFAPNIVFRSDNFGVVRAMVRAGLGTALIPSLGHLSDPRIKSTNLNNASSYRRTLALYRQANANPLLPDALRALLIAAEDEQLRCTAPIGWCSTDTTVDELPAVPTATPGEGVGDADYPATPSADLTPDRATSMGPTTQPALAAYGAAH